MLICSRNLQLFSICNSITGETYRRVKLLIANWTPISLPPVFVFIECHVVLFANGAFLWRYAIRQIYMYRFWIFNSVQELMLIIFVTISFFTLRFTCLLLSSYWLSLTTSCFFFINFLRCRWKLSIIVTPIPIEATTDVANYETN